MAAQGRRWWAAIAIFVIAGGIGFPVLFMLAVTVSPARTPDGHPVMPMGQAFFAIVASPLLAFATAYYFALRPRRG